MQLFIFSDCRSYRHTPILLTWVDLLFLFFNCCRFSPWNGSGWRQQTAVVGCAALARPAGAGSAGGDRGGAQMWRCAGGPPRPTTTLIQWSITKRKKNKTTTTEMQRTHTHRHTEPHTKPRHRLKSQSKLDPKGIPSTLFTKGTVYVF